MEPEQQREMDVLMELAACPRNTFGDVLGV